MTLCYPASDGVIYSVGQGNHRDLLGFKEEGEGKESRGACGVRDIVAPSLENTICLR